MLNLCKRTASKVHNTKKQRSIISDIAGVSTKEKDKTRKLGFVCFCKEIGINFFLNEERNLVELTSLGRSCEIPEASYAQLRL